MLDTRPETMADRALDELAAYVRFTPEDLDRLRAVAPLLEPYLPGLARTFYDAVEANPTAGAVLREGPKQVEQLKQSLQRWARDVLTHPRDSLYAEARRRIGAKHVELHLDHRYVLSAMAVVRAFLKDALRRELGDRAAEREPALDALDRALDLESALLSASYATIHEEHLLEVRGAEDRALRKIQSLLVQSNDHLVNLGAIRATLTRLLKVERIAISLDRPALGVFEHQGVDSTVDVTGYTSGDTIPYADCAMSAVVRTGLAAAVALRADDRLALHRALHIAGFRSLTMLPLWVEDRVVGTLNLVSSEPGADPPSEFLLAVADAVALAVARHESALKLFDSEEQFRSLFDAVADGLYVVDAQQRYRACNQVFLRICDRARDTVVGQTVDEVLPPDAAQRVRALHRDAFASGETTRGEIAVDDGGLRRWLSISLSPIRRSSGEAIALTGVVRDVTAERERSAQQAHQHKMTSLGLLAAGIAHEVSNPLASIACIAQDLEETTADEESRDLLRRIVTSTQRASRSLQQVLKFVRPSSRDGSALPVNDIVQQTLDMASFDPRARGLTFDAQLAPDLPNVRASADDVSQVLLNLLLNSMDAMTVKRGPPSARPPAPRLARAQDAALADIRVLTGRDGGQVTIVVEDHGPGIPPEHQQQVFEPFFTTKSAGRGTGLGLFVSAQIIKDLGGTIALESLLGEGTRFTLRLPVE